MDIPAKLIVPRLVHFSEQPRFPHEDLSSDNADCLSHHLTSEASRAFMQSLLFEHQHGLYGVALGTNQNGALRIEDSELSYQAFTSGFSLYRAILKVTQTARAEHLTDGAEAAQHLLLHRSSEIASMRLGTTHLKWQQTQPNAFGVIAKAHDELPLHHTHAASMGAAAAYRLSFDV